MLVLKPDVHPFTTALLPMPAILAAANLERLANGATAFGLLPAKLPEDDGKLRFADFDTGELYLVALPNSDNGEEIVRAITIAEKWRNTPHDALTTFASSGGIVFGEDHLRAIEHQIAVSIVGASEADHADFRFLVDFVTKTRQATDF